MARTVTLATLKERIRNLGELREIYVSDEVLTEEINSSLAELHDKLVAATPDYYESTYNVNIVADTASYALPEDFYKLQAVDVLRSDGDYSALKKYNLAERNFDNQSGPASREWTRYRVRGGYIVFAPTPSWTETNGVRLLYTPTPPRLSNDSDTVDDIANWSDWVVYDVIIKLVGGKEESDASQFERLLAKLNDRIEQMANTRDVGEPDSIRDLDEEDAQRIWPRYAPS